MEIRTIHTAMKAQAWEEAKGKLRALVAVAGSIPSRPVVMNPDSPAAYEYERLDKLTMAIAGFIEEIEDEGLAE